ncbi:MAG TPA: ABC transporter permease [Gemmatimonadaceae bacterium]|nr:ABC transporter permease [Gemmatimonadaceae bacterium]
MRYAIRRLLSSPGFTIAATLTMAIAIGATASVFGLVDGVLLKAFPYREAARVLTLWERNPAMRVPKGTFSLPDYLDVRAQSHVFTELAAADGEWEETVTGQQAPELVRGQAVTPSYFSVLGLTPVLGRGLSQDSGGPDEVVIGYGYWQRRFGGAPSVLGKALTIEDQPFTIVGVAPPGLPGGVELWPRWRFPNELLAHRDGHLVQVYGRLAPGVTPEAAQRELNVIAGRLATAYPQTNSGWSISAVPLPDQLVGDVRPALTMVLAAAACVLLIGAANLANLFLVRNLSRERELAVRTALGATRGRLVRELIAEALALGVVAAALGVGVAVAGVRILRGLAPATLPRIGDITVDGRVVAFCVLTTIATVLIFGVLPAWQASRGNPADAVKEGARGTGSARHHRVQDALVVLQVAMALVLLTGAGLLVETFARFQRSDFGYRPDGVLTAQVALSDQRYPTAERQTAFGTRLAEQLAAQPGVVAATASSALPSNPNMRWIFQIIGDPTPDPSSKPNVRMYFVSPGYYRTMGITLLRGRGVQPSDDDRSVRVAVIDELMARRFFAGRDPIGKRITFPGMPDADTLTIVGVAAAIRQGGLKADDVPLMYAPYAQSPLAFGTVSVSVRTSGEPEAQAAAIRRTVAAIDPLAPVSDMKPMAARVAESVGTTRFSTFLASLFAIVALVLGMVGIYSVLAYIVSQRRREIGVRLALGATHAHVIGDVMRRALALAGAGIAFGSIAAWWLTRGLAKLFVGVNPHDPTIFACAACMFTLVALAAAAIPAFRSTRVSPTVALKS